MTTNDDSLKKSDSKRSFVSSHPWRSRPQADSIPCPALLCFYNHGLLNPDDKGNVTLAELDSALAIVGVQPRVRNILTKGAENSDAIAGSFNLFALRDSSLDHTGSTGIRDPRVAPEKLDDALLNFSRNNRMYSEHFAAAANAARKLDPGLAGTSKQTVELTSILAVFGRIDESGQLYLTTDDIRHLWIDGRFPDDWEPRSQNDISLLDVATGSLEMAFARVAKAWGF